jgi:hypothetical protein
MARIEGMVAGVGQQLAVWLVRHGGGSFVLVGTLAVAGGTGLQLAGTSVGSGQAVEPQPIPATGCVAHYHYLTEADQVYRYCLPYHNRSLPAP